MPQNMFEIYDGRTSFWQWDTGQKLIVLDETVDQVHFSNKTMTYALIKEVYTEEGVRMCDIPDEVLSVSTNLIAYAYVMEDDNNKTLCAVTFSVRSRPVPEDYNYEASDRFKDIVDKIESVEDLVEKLSAGAKFNSFEEAEEWAKKEKKSGAIISVYVDGQWSAYMVEDDYNLAPVMKYDEALSSVYVQDAEPEDAEEGDIWVDTSSEATQMQETDPTVPDWAKAETKPSYTAEEVDADTKGSAASALAAANKYADNILSSAKTYADGTALNANTYADNAIKKTIGEVPSGKTVVQMIADAKSEFVYDDSVLVNRISGAENEVKAIKADYLKAADKAELENDINAVDSLVDTLVGSDSKKSVRTIANEELAKQLIPENAKESLNTLAEIASWIQNHPNDASAMNKAIEDVKNLIGALPSGAVATTIVNYIQEIVATEKTRAEGAESDLSGRVENLESAVGSGGNVQDMIDNTVGAAIKTEQDRVNSLIESAVAQKSQVQLIILEEGD